MKARKTKLGINIKSTLGMPKPKHERVWVLVANRAGAQVYQKGSEQLELVHKFSHSEGKKKESRLVSDRPGRSFDSWTRSKGTHQTGAPRHSMSSVETPAEFLLRSFCVTLSQWLEAKRVANKFDALVLIAEPRMIGRLKSSLDDETKKLIIRKNQKDYAWLNESELKKRLEGLLSKSKRSQNEYRNTLF